MNTNVLCTEQITLLGGFILTNAIQVYQASGCMLDIEPTVPDINRSSVKSRVMASGTIDVKRGQQEHKYRVYV